MICRSTLASLGIGALAFAWTLTSPAAEPQSVQAKPTQTTRALDLKPPLIGRIFTVQQIDTILARTGDPELEHIEVEAPRIGDLPLNDKSASLSSVVFKEVVRWLLPYPSVRSAQVNRSPDITDSYRPVPVSLSSYHASFPPPYNQH